MSIGLGLEYSGNFPYPVRMAEITFTSRLEIRLTDEDKALFQRAADQDGRPLSNWIRDRLLKAARAEVGTSKGKRS
jgi:uncharacterized protein (DUF1778 family)